MRSIELIELLDDPVGRESAFIYNSSSKAAVSLSPPS